MNFAHAPNLAFARRRGGSGMTEQITQQGPQLAPSVESPGKGTEVLAGALGELESIVGAVDPGEAARIAPMETELCELRELAANPTYRRFRLGRTAH